MTKLPPLREKQNNTPRFPHKALKHILEERKKSLRIWWFVWKTGCWTCQYLHVWYNVKLFPRCSFSVCDSQPVTFLFPLTPPRSFLKQNLMAHWYVYTQLSNKLILLYLLYHKTYLTNKLMFFIFCTSQFRLLDTLHSTADLSAYKCVRVCACVCLSVCINCFFQCACQAAAALKLATGTAKVCDRLVMVRAPIIK